MYAGSVADVVVDVAARRVKSTCRCRLLLPARQSAARNERMMTYEIRRNRTRDDPLDLIQGREANLKMAILSHAHWFLQRHRRTRNVRYCHLNVCTCV